jgi:hypothetical protein
LIFIDLRTLSEGGKACPEGCYGAAIRFAEVGIGDTNNISTRYPSGDNPASSSSLISTDCGSIRTPISELEIISCAFWQENNFVSALIQFIWVRGPGWKPIDNVTQSASALRGDIY